MTYDSQFNSDPLEMPSLPSPESACKALEKSIEQGWCGLSCGVDAAIYPLHGQELGFKGFDKRVIVHGLISIASDTPDGFFCGQVI